MNAIPAVMLTTRRRMLHALLGANTDLPLDQGLSRRRPGRDGLAQTDLPLQPDALNTPPDAVRWLTRATFGFSTPEHAAFLALGADDQTRWSAWLAQQFDPGSIGDSTCDSRLASAGFVTLGKTPAQLWADHHSVTDNYFMRMLPASEVECATLIRRIYSRRQLFEVVADFWHDHFSVFGWDYDGGPMLPAFDRDAIRPHVFGNFRNMLQATCESASMMYMLDLYTSYSGHPNENYARELLELHTLGAENYRGIVTDPDDDPSLPTYVDWQGKIQRLQYVDDDVYEAARVLTGWTISGSTWETRNDPNPGTFEYVQALHDAGVKRVLHRNFPAGGGQNDGTQLLDMLAQHPGTAHFVAGKLCRRFVGDNASETLVQSAADLFRAQWQAPDQIKQVLDLILQSSQFKTSWGTKMKRPTHAAISALRGLVADFTPLPDNTGSWTTSEEFIYRLQGCGNRLFYWPAPDGYPDTQEVWSSSSALGMTLKMLPRLLEMRQINGDSNSAFLADVQAQTLAAFPNAADRSALNIINYWCDRLLGMRPAQTHGVALDFLRQEAAATTPLGLGTDEWHLSPANQLSQHYTKSRLRTAIGLILCSPDFLRR
ncbi:MAG: DUF1800 domain-containing protein [Dokdonella sp.]|uniref:DUF1800 domain-containing protein n=1 Tax=Dokdonella sp. TaxID=2291710 RepID=UPI0025BBE7FC|nr:DUF1800 domain-containing protein [Dokdonella sp.]MBZ0222094.1 DUF1800 domain-containing protein [Dokdonella sp.]